MAQDNKPTLVQRPAGYDKLVPKGYKNVAKDKVYKKLEDITKTDVATFIAEMTPVIGDAIAAKEVYDEIQKDDPNWLLIGALGGATIIGVVPFVGDAASKLIKKGARQALDVAKRIEVDTNALGSLGGNIRIKAAQEVVEDFVPQKTVKAYKLFTKGKDGKLYPLFVDAQKEVPTDKWLAATFPDYRFTADNGKQYVPSKGTDGKPGTGDSINIPDQETRDKLIEAGFLPKGSKAKAVKAVAARPGWHAGDVPIATHIGPETNIGGKQVKYRGDDQVWAEIEMPADVDWQQIANSKARIKKDGNIDVRTADINDEMPKAGHYRYKTNPNMTGEWLISGDMKVNRVLDRSEVNAINEAAGVKDLPTLSELNKGYSKGGTVMDDYQYAEMMSNGYAVGGAVEKQTRMAFADGGVPIDPVSGNEVPPGSLPEEVRDDIKVGVSAGEYIVPADVLRYYGMKFFEDLRAEAKVALGSMEQDGRMGGDPIGKPMEAEDDLPFLTGELQSKDVPMNKGGYMRGYAEAGLVTDYSAGTQMENLFGDTSGIGYRTYYGPNGATISIQTFNGVPMTPIPAGYTLTAPVAVAPDVAPGTGIVDDSQQTSGNNGNNGGNDNNDDGGPQGKTAAEQAADVQKTFNDINWNSPTLNADLAAAAASRLATLQSPDLVKPTGLAGFVQSIIPGLNATFGGGLSRASNVAQQRAIADVLRARGDIKGAEKIESAVDAVIKDQGINLPNWMSTGNQWSNSLLSVYNDLGPLNPDGTVKDDWVAGGVAPTVVTPSTTTTILTDAEAAAKKLEEERIKAEELAAKKLEEERIAAEAAAAKTKSFVESATSASPNAVASSNIQQARNQSDRDTNNDRTFTSSEAAADRQSRSNDVTRSGRTASSSSAKAQKDKVEKSGSTRGTGYGGGGGRAKGGLMTKKK
jgi:hypothetical protein